MRNSILLCLVLAGCTATGSARYSAEATSPRLVYVSDDVQVIEDYHEPVFFSASMYWRYDNGVWYRSRYHTRGWVRVSTPPPQIVRIESPRAYIRYRGSAEANTQPGPSRQEVRQEMKEEKREQKEAAREEKQEDKREMKEAQREIKEEKREQKQEAKQEKQEAKQEKQEAKQDAKDAKHDHGKNKKK